MKPQRRKILVWSFFTLLLLALVANLVFSRPSVREAVFPARTNRYVPCPDGTHPKPDQRHICVPDVGADT